MAAPQRTRRGSRPLQRTYRGSRRFLERWAGAAPSEDADRVGIVPDLITDIRDELVPRALGIGKGSTREPGPAFGTARGLIAELSDLGVEDVGSRFALIVTEPSYFGMHWNIIPILDRRSRQPLCPDIAVAGDHDWLRQLEGIEEAIFFVRMVRSVHRGDYIRYPRLGIDGTTMGRIDQALLEHLDSQVGTPGFRWMD